MELKIDFEKFSDKLVPAIIQDIATSKVLMLGYMNKEAYETTLSLGKVTFYSRSKQRLWTKGEESGNYLEFKSIALDCDQDALLIKVKPTGPYVILAPIRVGMNQMKMLISFYILKK